MTTRSSLSLNAPDAAARADPHACPHAGGHGGGGDDALERSGHRSSEDEIARVQPGYAFHHDHCIRRAVAVGVDPHQRVARFLGVT